MTLVSNSRFFEPASRLRNRSLSQGCCCVNANTVKYRSFQTTAKKGTTQLCLSCDGVDQKDANPGNPVLRPILPHYSRILQTSDLNCRTKWLWKNSAWLQSIFSPNPLLMVYVRMQTIIECLRAASTGELPPSCKQGAAFIHDPQVGYHQIIHGLFFPAHQTSQTKKLPIPSLQQIP
jgi:hypothetical protein